jgi:hypothetical protein
MATVEEVIGLFPRRLRHTDPDQTIVDNLFYNFCEQAKNRWKYSAGNSNGFNAGAILSGSWMSSYSLNCGTLLDTFMRATINYFNNVVGHSIATLGVNQEDSTLWFPFVTKDVYRCFDARVRGNVCTTNRGVLQVRRALFSSHFFVKIGAKYYDPTFCTTYNNANDLVWLKLGGNRVEYHLRSRAKRVARCILSFGLARESKNNYYISEDGNYVFIKTSQVSHGFSETFCVYSVNQLTPQQKEKLGIR